MKLPNLTNFEEHPNEPGWLVFRFSTAAMAEEYAQELRRAGLRHEKDEGEGPPFLVGVRESHRETAVRLNYVVLGRHRSPFISDRRLRWGLILFLFALLGLAAAGAFLR